MRFFLQCRKMLSSERIYRTCGKYNWISSGEGGGPQAITLSSLRRFLRSLRRPSDTVFYFVGYGDAREALVSLHEGFSAFVYGIEIIRNQTLLSSVLSDFPMMQRVHLSHADLMEVRELPPDVTHLYSTALVNPAFYSKLVRLGVEHAHVECVTMFNRMWQGLGLSVKRLQEAMGEGSVVLTKQVRLCGGGTQFTLCTVYMTEDTRKTLRAYVLDT